jgi:hypothetical protein
MMSIVGLSATNPNMKRGILCTWIFWQHTHQSFSMRLTRWKRIASSAPQSPSLGYFTTQSIRRLRTPRNN